MEEDGARRELLRLVRRGAREGLLRGTFGNVSMRSGGMLLITPTAQDYLSLRLADFALVEIATGAVASGTPSSELPLHLEIYRRLLTVGAVWHDHTPFGVAAGLVTEEVPLYTGEGHGLIGLALPVAPYRPSGSWELAKTVATALLERSASACLMRNHGLAATGATLFAAYSCAIAAEEASMHHLLVRGAQPARLPPEEAQSIRNAFAAYRMR